MENYVAEYEEARKNFMEYAAEEQLSEDECIEVLEELSELKKVINNLSMSDLRLLLYLQKLCGGKKTFIYNLADKFEKLSKSIERFTAGVVDGVIKTEIKPSAAAAQAVNE